MNDTITEKLKSYGYTSSDSVNDSVIINLLRDEVEQYIKHYCNICTVPACLEYVVVEMVCGKFLQLKKSTGQLTELQLSGVLKSVQDGDTRVEYNVSYMADPEATFLTFIDKLINGHMNELVAHRRMRW